MDDPEKLLFLLQTISPGFVTTLIFYWLASVPKPPQFERVVQALICSGLIKLAVEGLKNLFLWIGQWWFISSWTSTVESLWSFALASCVGVALAWYAFNGKLYAWARKKKLTSRTSELIQEWDYAFLKYKDRYLVLNFLDGRRLMGYAISWPSDPINGHFMIVDPVWLESDGARPYDGVTSVLIANSDILWVEFLGPPEGVA